MNIFESWQQQNYLLTEEELKKQFRQMAKKLHPDSQSSHKDDAAFIRLKEDYEESLAIIMERESEKDDSPYNQQLCLKLFQELNALSFPVVTKLQKMNHYRRRIEQLNRELGKRGRSYENLLMRVQQELLQLRENPKKGIDTFLEIRNSINDFAKYTCYPDVSPSRVELKQQLLIEKLKRQKLVNTEKLVNWLRGSSR